jgi:multiple sugar transport system permease protein
MQARTVIRRAAARPRALDRRRPRYKLHTGLLLVSPWLIGLLLFKLLPILASLILSFTDLFLLTPDTVRFVGLENYLSILRDSQTWTVLLQALELALVIIPLQTGASIFLAAVLSSRKLLMKNTMRVLFFFPSIIPATAAAFMWQGFVNPLSGWLNDLFLSPLGLEQLNIFYTRGPGEALFILSSLWTIGPGTLIMMAAMQGITGGIYEAARIDGAGQFTRFLRITLPLISPAIFFSLIINLTAIFGGALLLDRGHAFSADFSSYDEYINYVLFGLFRMGYASGLAWVFFVFVLILVLTLFATSRRWVHFPDRED